MARDKYDPPNMPNRKVDIFLQEQITALTERVKKLEKMTTPYFFVDESKLLNPEDMGPGNMIRFEPVDNDEVVDRRFTDELKAMEEWARLVSALDLSNAKALSPKSGRKIKFRRPAIEEYRKKHIDTITNQKIDNIQR